MGICDISIKTDLKNKRYIGDKACKQNDTLILHFTLLDNSLMADLTGYACTLRANKGNGKGYEIISGVTVTIANGTAMISCPSSLTQFAGLLKLELTFNDTIHGLQKTTFDIEIQVDKSVIGNDDGNVPAVIITALEKLDDNLAQISDKIQQAESVITDLTSKTNDASSMKNALVNTTSDANSAKNSLQSATDNANTTIDQLKNANTAYTDHINNSDIHVTKNEKNYLAMMPDLVNLVNLLMSGSYLVDENGNNIVDENGNFIVC